ncbi:MULTISPECIES: type II toxin-antitoxin system HicA family toxin [Clostridioides]|uniref:type II toxin-antitoxin system HicA family toxin n=1 Tax=Clostridioides sp. ZZV14-6387 TaxID=2811497 RepID=UPI0007BC4B3A|nr:type II toxin-antitoxin system HicA family toxin [Clostridioides sp. ZZV14-6387]WLD26544.1 HicA toxin of bacterial toxin-antitoxin [Clostridioides difficile]CZR95527.1 YcfA-like protein [Clostridioides difficile]CZR99911.1 YcfA-like protein [Clostridioides difficile]
MRVREVLKIAYKNGWEVKSQRGSHIKLIHKDTNKTAIIPNHNKDIPVGTLNSIFKMLGLK